MMLLSDMSLTPNYFPTTWLAFLSWNVCILLEDTFLTSFIIGKCQLLSMEGTETPGANKWQFSTNIWKYLIRKLNVNVNVAVDITKTCAESRLKDETPADRKNRATTILQDGKKVVVTLNPMCHNNHFQVKCSFISPMFAWALFE